MLFINKRSGAKFSSLATRKSESQLVLHRKCREFNEYDEILAEKKKLISRLMENVEHSNYGKVDKIILLIQSHYQKL